ncbi:hypothetical protein HYH03_017565 [Edaphochlamys debaryana]|uniref:CCHC-type domain-containing protein n=1 Tax=Edaphochlamys debaryana TaxID=47281 RepID=A0A835XGB5_9CHLO|nr:hypothetical protein HYH03_017565 [Edaphochlamys debaryana]|eukprot:KAG2483558.1 hypothetical protein HYH03_017565 [Edaphochlamys debaryana]
MAAAARVPQPLLRRPTAAVRSQHLCPRHGARQAHAPPPACLPLAAPAAAGRRATAAAAAASPLGGGGGGKELAQERQAPVEPWRRIAAGVISLLVGAGLLLFLLFLLWSQLVLPNWPAWKGNVPLPIVWAAAAAAAAGVAAAWGTVIKSARTWVFGQVPSDVDKPRPADAPRLEHPASPPLPDDARNVPATAGQVDDMLAVLKEQAAVLKEQAADVKKQEAVLKKQAADVKKLADNYDELSADMGAIAEATAGQALRQTLGAEVVGGRKVLRNANSLVVALVPHVPGYGAAVYVAAEECLVSYLMANGVSGRHWKEGIQELDNGGPGPSTSGPSHRSEDGNTAKKPKLAAAATKPSLEEMFASATAKGLDLNEVLDMFKCTRKVYLTRKYNGECLRCGNSGHRVDSCPQFNGKGKGKGQKGKGKRA